jgi:hypothetical protein
MKKELIQVCRVSVVLEDGIQEWTEASKGLGRPVHEPSNGRAMLA